MIDLANYNRAIQWLKRGMAAQAIDPESAMMRDGLFHSVEVTYNVTETILRQALGQLSGDSRVPLLSSRDLMRYAAEEGLTQTSSAAWLRYGLALEQANETLGDSFSSSVLPLLPQYVQDLECLCARLGTRLVPNA
jgi:hypothetical protein